MEAPRCLFCGTRHWPRQACPKAKEFARATPIAQSKILKEAVCDSDVVDVKGGSSTSISGSSSRTGYFTVSGVDRGKGKFDRTAYQREYMRKRRREMRSRKLGSGGPSGTGT
jgi:hypothetical protein